MSRKTLMDVRFNDIEGLFNRLKEARRLATKRGTIGKGGASTDAVIYLTGPHGEPLTRLVIVEQYLTDGSTVLEARLEEESVRENVRQNHGPEVQS